MAVPEAGVRGGSVSLGGDAFPSDSCGAYVKQVRSYVCLWDISYPLQRAADGGLSVDYMRGLQVSFPLALARFPDTVWECLQFNWLRVLFPLYGFSLGGDALT